MATKKIFIVGGDGFARECYNNLINLAEYGKEVVFLWILPHSKMGNNNKIAPLSALYKGCKDNCYMAEILH